ncbi:MAG: hypothetical protein ACU841_06805 [Gammaproteobacteria bacterium]
MKLYTGPRRECIRRANGKMSLDVWHHDGNRVVEGVRITFG